jgi:Asp-tRNA(Asn)/Glu-tRNA(Gln) amidotransferase A subunit family amidase
MLDDIAAISQRHWDLMAYEMAQEHAHWFAQYGSQYRPRTAELIRRGQTVSAEDAAAARTSQAELRTRLSAALAEAGADLWICPPATGPAPEGLGSTGDTAMNLPWTHAGLPVISVPAGFSDAGLPMGLQCIGLFGEDERLLNNCDSLYGVFN